MMIVRELREAWRRLVGRLGYTLLSVVVLGVGLGVLLFLFAMINDVILQPLPFPQANRLVAVGEPVFNGIGGMDSDQYLQLRGKLHSMALMGAYTGADINLDSGSGATHHTGALLTASMMKLLGIKPLLGRSLVPADDKPDAPRVVLLNEALWRHAFAADPHIIGRAVRVNGAWATVVGVLPSDVGFPSGDTEAWMPLHLESGRHGYISVAARLAPAIQLDQARAELNAWAGRLQRTLPPGQRAERLTIYPLSVSFAPLDLRRWLWLMFGAGVVVMLLACINVANLQLMQTLQRRHELALRSALGGSRARLMLGALIESLLLAAAALAVALPVAHGCIRWMHETWMATHPDSIPFTHGIDGWVLAFGAAVAMLGTALAGGIPAWRASRPDLQDALRDGSKGSGGGFARVAKVMVVVEVALTVVLLVGAGTFVRALDALLAQPTVGATHATHVLTANVALPPKLYRDDAQRIRFFDSVVERLRQDPGVVDATASDTVPSAVLGSHEDVSLPGQVQPSDGWLRPQMGIVDPHFLDTYGVRLLEGRFFDARDHAGSEPVVVVDAKMAATMWPHQGALNRKLVLYPGHSWAKTVTVVGVVQSLQLDSMTERSRPGLLMPLDQAATMSPLHAVGLAVRTHAAAVAFSPRLTDAVHGVDPQAAVYAVYSQAKDIAVARVGLVVLTDVFSGLGLVALLLAAAGLYGVLAFSVEQRTREIGIRRAIGAVGGAILRDAGRQLFWQLGLGLLIGFVLAVPWSNVLASPDLRTRAHDPVVFVTVLLLVGCVSVLAVLLPLLRALRVDPAIALRYE
ncbi:ADOP family duplicated permease [Dyella sp. A6]|uniref:ADOP family duplicated permease n=1 Tax=Dyella aluminiiresistens TaxID=3069105 RepID=UPI002E782BE1|nr:ADOP family duplicated permease [Dyella sp. A6]